MFNSVEHRININSSYYHFILTYKPYLRKLACILICMGFPCGSAGKEYACNAGDLGLISGLGRSPGEGKGYPLQCSGLENSMGCIVHGVAKNRTQLSDFHFTLVLATGPPEVPLPSLTRPWVLLGSGCSPEAEPPPPSSSSSTQEAQDPQWRLEGQCKPLTPWTSALFYFETDLVF